MKNKILCVVLLNISCLQAFENDNQESFQKLETAFKTALITGITGQDGSLMTEFLLKKGYKVYGTFRRTSSQNFWRIEELGIKTHPMLSLLEMDITDGFSVLSVLKKTQPDEIYNFAAQSFVGLSFQEPYSTAYNTGLSVVNLLESIRKLEPEIHKKMKFYQASTSEMYGKVQAIPQDENTPYYPRSPYGVAKLYAHWITINYRESYNLFACCGTLFNHESQLRGPEFVTRKITQAVAAIKSGKQEFLELGNLDAKRDWGFAGDYIEGAYLMLQQDTPDDYVLATGRTETVRFFLEKAFLRAGIEIDWKGEGEQEYGINRQTQKTLIKINPKFYRPAEVDLLIGNAKKAEEKLGWKPKVELEKLIELMVDADLKRRET